MGGLFSSPKETKMPKVDTSPEPVPQVEPDVKKRPRRRGRPETILTGELEPVTTKKTLLAGA